MPHARYVLICVCVVGGTPCLEGRKKKEKKGSCELRVASWSWEFWSWSWKL